MSFWKRFTPRWLRTSRNTPFMKAVPPRGIFKKPELVGLEDRIAPATFTVTNLLNSGLGSLRDAVTLANVQAGADTIDFAPELTATAAATVSLFTSGSGSFGQSALAITSDITLVGPTGSNGITLNTTIAQRLFYVSLTGSLTVSSLTLSGGKAQGGNGIGGGGGGGGLGGAVFNAGILTLHNSTLSGNLAIGGNGSMGAQGGSYNSPTGTSGFSGGGPYGGAGGAGGAGRFNGTIGGVGGFSS